MFEQYAPHNICKAYAEIQGSPQLPMFIAVVNGIKPLMDDWIPLQRYQEFKEVCRKYKVHVKPNCIFKHISASSIEKTEGKEVLTTTKKEAFPFSPTEKDGFVHVYISGSKKIVDEAPKFGWYTMVVDGAAVANPLIDNLRYGLLLGYPRCCVSFFLNDRQGVNQLYEAYRNTSGEPSFYCNALPSDFTYFLVHNYPCSFSCRETIKQGRELLKVIKEEEPEYASRIEHHLKLPLLVFRIRDAIAFEGKMSGDEITYSDSYHLTTPNVGKAPYEKFKAGNRIRVTKDTILVYRDELLLHSIKKEGEGNGFLLKFF